MQASACLPSVPRTQAPSKPQIGCDTLHPVAALSCVKNSCELRREVKGLAHGQVPHQRHRICHEGGLMPELSSSRLAFDQHLPHARCSTGI